eukprot:2786254-Ditylum_brightwellii.AAC.1
MGYDLNNMATINYGICVEADISTLDIAGKIWLSGGRDRDGCHCNGYDGDGSHSTPCSLSH